MSEQIIPADIMTDRVSTLMSDDSDDVKNGITPLFTVDDDITKALLHAQRPDAPARYVHQQSDGNMLGGNVRHYRCTAASPRYLAVKVQLLAIIKPWRCARCGGMVYPEVADAAQSP